VIPHTRRRGENHVINSHQSTDLEGHAVGESQHGREEHRLEHRHGRHQRVLLHNTTMVVMMMMMMMMVVMVMLLLMLILLMMMIMMMLMMIIR
jgi:hypothetical protein